VLRLAARVRAFVEVLVNAAGSLKERILAEVASTPSPTRRQSLRRSRWLLAASIAVALAMFGMAGGVAHCRGRPLPVTLRLADGWALASAVITWAVARGLSRLGRSARLLFLVSLACPAALFAWTRAFPGAEEAPMASAALCAASTLAFAAAPLAYFFSTHRGAEPQHPEILGAGGAAACVAWAGVLVLLWCPITSGWHVLLGHVIPAAAVIVLGSVLGRGLLNVASGGAGTPNR
jgi:hypothetical protein